MSKLRKKIIKILDQQDGRARRSLVFDRLWREAKPEIERAVTFLEADDLIGAGRIRTGGRGPQTAYIWLTQKGRDLARELNEAQHGITI